MTPEKTWYISLCKIYFILFFIKKCATPTPTFKLTYLGTHSFSYRTHIGIETV